MATDSAQGPTGAGGSPTAAAAAAPAAATGGAAAAAAAHSISASREEFRGVKHVAILDGGCVYMDFDVESKTILRVSMDGEGCCTLDPPIPFTDELFDAVFEGCPADGGLEITGDRKVTCFELLQGTYQANRASFRDVWAEPMRNYGFLP